MNKIRKRFSKSSRKSRKLGLKNHGDWYNDLSATMIQSGFVLKADKAPYRCVIMMLNMRSARRPNIFKSTNIDFKLYFYFTNTFLCSLIQNMINAFNAIFVNVKLTVHFWYWYQQKNEIHQTWMFIFICWILNPRKKSQFINITSRS